jgi:hypothetical protein
MFRWAFLLISACLLACSGPSRSLEESIPSTVKEWKRTAVSPLNESEAPPIVRQLGLKRAISATYQGPATVNVRVYEMKVPTSAFELIQKWRQQDGPAVYTGPYFLVADSNPETAAGLLEGLRKQLK